jgi:DNA-binding beta-propeller fold protein YncE
MRVLETLTAVTLGALLVSGVACNSNGAPETPESAKAAVSSVDTPGDVPRFEYDASWPKLPLPHEWILGEVGGVGNDPTNGHIWLIQRPWTVFGRELAAVDGSNRCCRAAPSVIEFDAEGNVLQGWPEPVMFHAPPGSPLGQTYGEVGPRGEDLWQAPDGPYGPWGRREHTVYIDPKGFVWLTIDESHVVYKFTKDGKWLMTLGIREDPPHPLGNSRRSNDTTRFGRPTGVAVDPDNNQVFISDGYDNRRVIVFDGDTGKYIRHWGAYGAPPDDSPMPAYDPKAPPSKQFSTVHGVVLSRDKLVYVADRANDRIQVFRQDGTFVKEGIVAPETTDIGSAYGVALSADPEQKWVYVNGVDSVRILRRDTMQQVGEFGSQGRFGGQLLSAHSITVDNKGNIYIGESRGRRVQKFRLVSGDAGPR